jgi:peptidoglycan/xylan/chitin deacetylase (PgdA/CDA1 family)
MAAVGAATGTRPVWFRPPYGASNGAVRKQERALGVKVAMWDIDTLDWTRPGPHAIFRNAVRSTKSGQIVLMHDGGGDRAQTIEALPLVIGDLRSKGFTFVTLEEMAAAR